MSNNISSVSISLRNAATPITNFSDIVFADAHPYFPERVREYANITEVGNDFPTTSNAYIAATGAFSSDTPPARFKIGRVLADFSVTPLDVQNGNIYQFTLNVAGGFSVVASYTAGVSDDAEAVVDGLLADIATDVDVSAQVTASKVGTGTAAILQLAQTGVATDIFWVTGATTNLGFGVVSGSEETPVETLQALVDQDNDFYFYAHYDKTPAAIQAIAGISASFGKIYVTTSSDTSVFAPLPDIPVSVFDHLLELNSDYVFVDYHQDADTKFPEVAAIVPVANSRGGDYVVGTNQVQGVTASRNKDTGLLLNSTEKGYLRDRNAGYFSTNRAFGVHRDGFMGKVVSGKFLDEIRNRDILEAELNNGLSTYQINTPITPYTQSGVDVIDSVISTILDRRKSTKAQPNILDERVPYILPELDVADIPLADKQSRVFNRDISLFFAGAIQRTNITATLTFNQAV